MSEPAVILHLPTMLFLGAVLIAFCGGLLLTAHRPMNGSASIRLWGMAMLTGAAGLVAIAQDHDAFRAGTAIGNGLLLTASAMAWSAVRLFVGKRALPWAAAIGPAFWFATVPFQASPSVWIALACAIGLVYVLAAAAAGWNARSEALPSLTPAVVLLSIHAAAYAARCIGALTGANRGPYAVPLANAFVLEGILYAVGLTFFALAMVKERMELQTGELLRALALQDGLTGVGNRRYFDEQLDAEISRARRHGWSLAVLMIDVDHFKAFNDAFGHQRGDACLRTIAENIATLARRPGDVVARYGGEEFAVLLANTEIDGAIGVAETLRETIRALGIDHVVGCRCVTISIGAAALVPHHDGHSGTALVGEADAALYEAKRSGRDAVRAKSAGAIDWAAVARRDSPADAG